MVDAMLDLLPKASVHHIGMYKTKNSLMPVQYYNRLPRNTPCDVAFVCDVSIATASTMNAVISMLKKWGAKKIIVIAILGSDMGIRAVIENHPDVKVHVASIDKELAADGTCIPGIGDCSDRMFSTPIEDVIEPSGEPICLTETNKRQRSNSDIHVSNGTR